MSVDQPGLPSSSEGIYSLPPRVLSAGRKLLRLPLLRHLKPYARQMAAVTETSGKYVLREISHDFSPRKCNLITVMSANLWHDWPLYRRLPERLNAFSHLVDEERVDILLLQEVVQTPDLNAGEWLADRLGMGYVYTRANGHQAIGFEEGLAVLSKFKLSDPQIRQLSSRRNPFVRRLALGATVNTPCGEISAISVHLGLTSKDNDVQQEQLRQLVNGKARHQSVVVGGDFNVHETSPQIEKARASWVDTYRSIYPHGDAHTHVLSWPWGGVLSRKRLDYIFLHSEQPRWQVVDARHITTPGRSHSDHQAVLTRLASLN